MKKRHTSDDEPRSEYDFSKGVRGKYAGRYAAGSQPTHRRLRDVKVGTIVFAGQSTNHDLIPFSDSDNSNSWIRYGRNTKIAKETKAYWITDDNTWYRKRDGLRVPTSPMRLYLVPVRPDAK